MQRIATLRAAEARAREVLPGLVAAAIVAVAASFLSTQYAAPVMLLALLLGAALNVLSAGGVARAGVEFAARDVLRIGVALLGIRITFEQIGALGWQPAVLIVIATIATILASIAVARAMRFNPLFGLLTGGATAICGASAALALAASLPRHPGKDRATLFTVLIVSLLSTLAMIGYPVIAGLLGLSPDAAGVFLGASIHDVAQVIGAGYSLSPEVGDRATVVKLMRVALLAPVILCASMLTRTQSDGGAGPPPLLPWFAVAFLALAALNSAHFIPPTLQRAGGELSRWCLIVAMSALGMKTRVSELASVGWRPIVLMVAETIFLAVLVLLLLALLR